MIIYCSRVRDMTVICFDSVVRDGNVFGYGSGA